MRQLDPSNQSSDMHIERRVKDPLKNIKKRVRNLPPEKQAILLQVLERLEAGEGPFHGDGDLEKTSEDGCLSRQTSPGRADSEWLPSSSRSRSLSRADSTSYSPSNHHSPFDWWQPPGSLPHDTDLSASPPTPPRASALDPAFKKPQRRGSLPPMVPLTGSSPGSPVLRNSRLDISTSQIPPRCDRVNSMSTTTSPSVSLGASPCPRRPTPPCDPPSPAKPAFTRTRAGSLPPLPPDPLMVPPIVTIAPVANCNRELPRAHTTQEFERDTLRPYILQTSPHAFPLSHPGFSRAESVSLDSEGPLFVTKMGILSRHKSKNRVQVHPPNELSSVPHLDVRPSTFQGVPDQRRHSFSSSDHISPSAPRDDPTPRKNSFRIPFLPCGRHLTINIISNWGDPHYFGLTGLEIFDSNGQCVSDPKTNRLLRVCAQPDSVNVLPGQGGDPRTVDRLLDGVHRTSDDAHMWLAPFSEGRAHFLHIDLGSATTLAMLRFWNYNKSRIHSYRGARYLEVTLDSTAIFRGEIHKAPGHLESDLNFSDCILFTLDDEILELIEAVDKNQSHDVPPPARSGSSAPCSPAPAQRALGLHIQDPQTALTATAPFAFTPGCCDVLPGERPPTAVGSALRPGFRLNDKPISACSNSPYPSEHLLPKAMTVVFTILSSWGHPNAVGLTGLQVLNQFQESHEMKNAVLSASRSEDSGSLSNLVDGRNVTTDSSFMWLISQTPEARAEIKISFPRAVTIAGFRVWNYNAGLADTVSGVRRLKVFLDDQPHSPDVGFLLNKAPGHADFDFGQTVLLRPLHDAMHPRSPSEHIVTAKQPITEDLSHDPFHRPLHPEACVFRLQILSSHGETDRVGLSAIALYDTLNESIDLGPSNLKAIPQNDSVVAGSLETRTLDRLLARDCKGMPANDGWLAPFRPGTSSWLCVVFEEPVTISAIKIWNYSKNPDCGVKGLMVWADDRLIYRGALHPAHRCPEGYVLIFTDDPRVLAENRTDQTTPSTDYISHSKVLQSTAPGAHGASLHGACPRR